MFPWLAIGVALSMCRDFFAAMDSNFAKLKLLIKDQYRAILIL
jgi:hypothetical protein